MALVGNISGSASSNSIIGVTGSLVFANANNASFPAQASDTIFYVSGAKDGTAQSVFGGNLVISGSTRIKGDLTVDGTTTYVNTENLLVKDPFVLLNSGSAGTDMGVIFAGGNGSNDVILGVDNKNGTVAVVTADSVSGSITTYPTSSTLASFYAATYQVGAGGADLSSTPVGYLSGSGSDVWLQASSYLYLSSSLVTLTQDAAISGSLSQGLGPITLGSYSHAEGYQTVTSGAYSHAEGYQTVTSGAYSHAEGRKNIALGAYSHAEGRNTFALGFASHAEGYQTVTSGAYSHAEGNQTKTVGTAAHTEGYASIAGVRGATSCNFVNAYTSSVSGDETSFFTVGDVVRVYDLEGSGKPYTTFILDGLSYDSSAGETFLSSSVSVFLAEQFIDGGRALFVRNVDPYGAGTPTPASHAEGLNTIAAGSYSHAEGSGSIAHGFGSHVEGDSTRASGAYSHTEGYQTITLGSHSHAEGNSTTASGAYSHAEGDSTSTYGIASHAEGAGTTAGVINFPLNLHSISGDFCTASIGSSDLTSFFTVGNVISSFQDSQTGVPYQEATLTGMNYDGAVTWLTASLGVMTPAAGIVDLSIEIPRGTPGSIEGGGFSHAEGDASFARGTFSHAEGSSAEAYGYGSHAEGYQTKAYGENSHAEGSGTIALGLYSHAEGSNTVASGSYSHAEGYQTTVRTDASHAEGDSTTVVGYASHAEGSSTTAGTTYFPGVFTSGTGSINGDVTSYFGVGHTLFLWDRSDSYGNYKYSTIMGVNYDVSGDTTYVTSSLTDTYVAGARLLDFSNVPPVGTDGTTVSVNSHAEGCQSQAFGDNSHAEGSGTFAAGNASHVEGEGGQASGHASHAEGSTTLAAGESSHAEGSGTTASGVSSHAEGSGTTASGAASHAEGENTTASGDSSHAEGEGTFALGDASHAGGFHTIASGSNQTVIGQYNKRNNTTSLFTIGNGTGDDNASRSDVVNVYISGVEVTGSTRIKGDLTVDGSTTTGSISGDLIVSGRSNLGTVVENILTSNGGTGTVAFSLSEQSIFYRNAPTGNITANFTSVPATTNKVISTTVILSQSSPAYIVSAVQINGVAQTLNWVNGVTPSGTANKHDAFGFSLIRSGSTPTWVVLGQMSTYG